MIQQNQMTNRRVAVGYKLRAFLRRRHARLFLLLLFSLMTVGLSVDSLRRESVTLDEPLHLTAGYAFWSFGDYRLQLSHGALPQRWYAIPLLFTKHGFPSLEDPSWRQPGYLGLEACQKFFYSSGNDPDAMVFYGRLMAVAMAVLLVFSVAFWTKRVFGRVASLLACLLCAIDPTILAHGRLMTSDVPAALFFLMSVGCIWSLIRRFTWLRLILSITFFGFVLVSKMSGGLVFLMALVMLILRMALRRPWHVRLHGLQPFVVRSNLGKSALAAGTVMVHAVGAILIIWSFYGFQYAPAPEWMPLRDSYTESRESMFESLGSSKVLFEFLEKWKLLPDAYCYGLAHTIHHAGERHAFLNGSYGSTGWWYYFLYAFWVKTPLSLIGLVALGIVSIASAIQSRKYQRRAAFWVWLDRTSIVWVIVIGYFAVALVTNLNIGHRHLLPIYPPLFILAGLVTRWLTRGGQWIRATIALLILLTVSELSTIHPHYLAYFNILAGGPSKGYLHLTDSNVDWGQDLPTLAGWLREQPPLENSEAIYFRYFGFDSPKRWGIQARSFPNVSNPRFSSDYPIAFRPGIYCFSATDFILPGMGKPAWDEEREREYRQLLQAFREFEQMNAMFDEQEARRRWEGIVVAIATNQWHRLRNFLVKRKPDAMPGYSILVFRISEQELQDALLPTK